MKLTAKEKRAVLRAVEIIENEIVLYSCAALNLSKPGLETKYAKFYGYSPVETWDGMLDVVDYSSRKELRILLLLNFLECCK